jgi:3-oxoacyl-[acyl-carrier protein] reductase
MGVRTVEEIRLDGRVAIVTGGAGALGSTMAKAFAGAGARVAFVDVAAAALGSVIADVKKSGVRGEVTGIVCDITRTYDCERTIAEVVAKWGGLHILVNNAALGNIHVHKSHRTKSLKFWEADPEVWSRVVETNVLGTFRMSHFAVPHMLAAGWGRIMNVTTSLPSMVRPFNTPYAISKVAIEGETLVWSKELAGTGVTVNTVIPGSAVDTPFVYRGSSNRQTLLKPDVMIAPALWLASTMSDGVTGMRFAGKYWDKSLPPTEAAFKAREPHVINDEAPVGP